MDFEKIFPFIIFIVVWAAMATKQYLKKNRNNAGETKTPSVTKLVFDLLQQTITGGLTAGENPIERETQETSPAGDFPPVITNKIFDIYAHPKKPSQEQYEQPLILENPAELKEVPEIKIDLEETPVLRGIQQVQTKQSRRVLQNAIIWSEILAKPVALRE